MSQIEHDSILRNRKIAHVFYVRKFIEKWGSGTTRIINLCKNAGVPEPKYYQHTGGFCISFKFNKIMNTTSKNIEPTIETLPLSLAKKAIRISARQRQILEILKNYDSISLSELVVLMDGVSDRLIRDDLYNLKKTGQVGTSGRGRGSIWFLVK